MRFHRFSHNLFEVAQQVKLSFDIKVKIIQKNHQEAEIS